jgi:hypothetical protein
MLSGILDVIQRLEMLLGPSITRSSWTYILFACRSQAACIHAIFTIVLAINDKHSLSVKYLPTILCTFFLYLCHSLSVKYLPTVLLDFLPLEGFPG